MTEDEAKTKLCPVFFISVSIGNLTATHLKSAGAPPEKCAQAAAVAPPLCQGSACMMWRWDERRDFVFDKVSVDRSDPDRIVNTRVEKRNTDAPTGYCGLAGKP